MIKQASPETQTAESRTAPRHKQRALPPLALLILLGYLALGLVYSVTTPIWEGHDETGHYPVVRYVATHFRLPPAGGEISDWYDQGHQPPLYYLLGALTTFWVDTGDGLQPEINLPAFDGSGRSGYNIALHSREEQFPYRGSVLAFHLTRLLSLLIGAGTVLVTYLLSKEIFPDREDVALGAMAINAFLPLFLFMSSLVNNDVMIAFTAGLVLLGLLRVLRRPAPAPRPMLLLGGTLGLALLSKNNALALIPLLGLALLVPVLERRWALLATVRGGLFLVAGAFVVSGWWYIHNLIRYGVPFPDRAENNALIENPFGGDVGEASSGSWLETLISNTFHSFWGYFGWGNVQITDGWLFYLLALFMLLAALGLGRFFLNRRVVAGDDAGSRVALALLLLSPLLFAGLALYRAIYFQDPYLVPGRYLLPAVSAIGILLATGFFALVRGRRLWLLPIALLILLAVVTPFRYIAPAYALPPRVTEDAVAGQPVEIRFGDKMELLAYEIEEARLLPGEELHVTFYWRALKEMEEDYVVGIHILGKDLQSWGALNTHPGPGTYPTSQWRPGEIIQDHYRVLLSRAPVPAMGQLSVGVGLFAGEGMLDAGDAGLADVETLTPQDTAGSPITPIFGRFKLVSTDPVTAEPPSSPTFHLGDRVTLAGYDLSGQRVWAGESLEVTLFWEAQQAMEKDYTVFLHLVDSAGELVANWDAPPLHDAYPTSDDGYPTSLWDVGEMVKDERQLPFHDDLPAGRYTLYTGMYRRDSLERLSMTDGTGEALPGDAAPLAEIEVEAP